MNMFTMMTARKHMAATVMGAVLCFGIVFSSVPMQTHAQSPSMTNEEMLTQIQELMIIIMQLQAQLAVINEPTSPTPVGDSVGKLVVKRSSDDPDASSMLVEEDDESDDFTVLVFEIEEENDIDVTIENMTFDVDLGNTSASADAVIDEARLLYKGMELAEADATAQGFITFENIGLEIDGGTAVELEVSLVFEEVDNYGAGTVIDVSFERIDEAEDYNGNDESDMSISGGSHGASHTLITGGLIVSEGDTDVVVTVQDVGGHYATYVIEIEITAFEEDVFIASNPFHSIEYSLETSSGGAAPAGTESVSLVSTADEEGSVFEISEGESETMTITVVYTSSEDGVAARLQLDEIMFGESAANPTAQRWVATPQEEYRTGVVTLVRGSDEEPVATSTDSNVSLQMYLKKEGKWFSELPRKLTARKNVKLKWDMKGATNCELTLRYQRGVQTMDVRATGQKTVSLVKSSPDLGLNFAKVSCDGVSSQRVSVDFYSQKKTHKIFVNGKKVQNGTGINREGSLSRCLQVAEKNISKNVLCMHGEKTIYTHGTVTSSEEKSIEAELGEVLVEDAEVDTFDTGEASVLGASISVDAYTQLASALNVLDSVLARMSK